ncbi:MAG: alpha/beta fold hydrolase [Acidobacteriota bacterium]
MLRLSPLARAVVLALAAASPAAAAPCTEASAACTEWITLGPGPERSLVYRSYPLNTPNPAIARAFVMVHGAGRDADNYFRHALAAAFLAGALDDTLIVSPRFASNDGRGCTDALDANEVNWPCAGNSWRSGGPTAKNPALTSFHLMDRILRLLARKDIFPNLQVIVVGGHSAGGQFANRYAMANTVHDTLGVPVRYVVANPSSYAYLDPIRPGPAGDGGKVAFGPFAGAATCATFDSWPYGLRDRAGYTAEMTRDALAKNLAARPTTFLIGQLDILPLAGFDSSCAAMAQGPNRLARGQAYGQYVNEVLGASHATSVVPLCGHHARCMFTSDPVLPLIFPVR